MPNIVTIINGVFPPLYLNSKTKRGISTSIRLAQKTCDEGSPPPSGRSLGCMNLCPLRKDIIAKGSNGSSGVSLVIYPLLFVGHVREARKFWSWAYFHAAWLGKEEWLYLGNSVFVDPIRGC